MQLSTPLLCLFITIAAGSYGDGHQTSLKGMPRIAKRQTDDLCNDILAREVCTNGYYEDYAYLAARCSQRYTAQYLQDICSVTVAGTICATFDTDSQSIRSVCSTSTTTCTSECRAALSNVRAELGCCINAYNTTDPDGDPDDRFIYSYALWSACNIEQVTERCTPSFELPTGIDPTCNRFDFENLLYSRVLCRADFADSLRAVLVQGGCADLAPDVNSCAVDDRGEYCIQRNNLYDQLDTASVNCRDTDTCSNTCADALNDIINVSGCCFISEFNGTEQRDFLSYDFWQRCGLTSPGFCELKLDTSDSRISGTASEAPGKTITIAVALFGMALLSPFI